MKRICIIDDQQISLDALSVIFNKSQHLEIIGKFTSAESFINQYEILLPDITIMDLDLPGVTGIEAIMILKSSHPDAKFLVLTNHNDDERLFNALRAGASGYLLKKDSYANLEAAIISILEGGAPMSPEIARKVILYFKETGDLNGFNSLTEKEKDILKYLVDGFLYKEIAEKLSVSLNTIKNHTPIIYQKLQVRSRSEAIKKYFTH